MLVNTSDGKYLIAGDAIAGDENWEAPGHAMIGVFSSMEDQLASFAKLDNLGDIKVLPRHEARVLEHSVYPY